MARPLKRTAEYFPHSVENNQVKFILEQKWGNDGYAFWYKLRELLCINNGHYYDYSIEVNKLYLTAYTKISEETAENMLNTLVELEEIDRELWERKRVIWCQSLVDDLEPLYSKRTVTVPKKPDLEQFTDKNTPITDISVPETEKKAEETKKPKKKKPEKIKYAEYVFMTAEEYEKLSSKYGEEKAKRMIEVLDNYKGSKGKTYKDDYRAILSWVVEKVCGENNGGGNYGQGEHKQQSDDFNEFIPSTGFAKW